MTDILKLNTEELKALVVYQEVLEKNKSFPKDFWTNERYQLKGVKLKCKVLTRYCFENLAHLKIEDLPKYNLKQLKKVLIKGKLFGMVQIVFNHDVIEILKNAYPEEFKKRILKEWMWSKHGIWSNDEYIIEALKDMVAKEGIRHIEDIPTLDWKKRLLKHGIYNILSYFNWSIYNLFNFVYPNKFHPADFRYKTKWAASQSLDNAFYYMHKVFKKNRFSIDNIVLLNTSDFRRLGFAGMLIALFDSSTILAKEYYLYKTIDNKENQQELLNDMNRLHKEKFDEKVTKRLKSVAVGKYIYNLHDHATIYNFMKRHAHNNNVTICEFIKKYGFIYKTAKNDNINIPKDELWNLRKQRLTYIEIAQKYNTNPTTVAEVCKKYFGADPLIPRPVEDYITVQEVMDKYHVDHKTVMKLVRENNFENHTTIRLRYLKKQEIIPAVKKYTATSKQHQFLIKRYAN